MTEVAKVLEKYGNMLVETTKKKLIAANKYASGSLVNSLVYKYSYSNGKYKIQITGAKHLINVDQGRKPNSKQPPIQAIEAWLKVKKFRVGGKMKPAIARGKKAPTEKELKAKAYVIARAIGKRGVKPFPILNLGQTIANSAKFKQDIKDAIVKDTTKVLGGMNLTINIKLTLG